MITGAGRGFCSGQDLKEFRICPRRDRGRRSRRRTTRTSARSARSRSRSSRRSTARARAPGSRSRARATCASPRLRRRSCPGFIGIGLVPDSGGSWFVHRLLGFARAFEWMVSNRRLTPEEALEWGLVSEVVEADGFAARVAGAGGVVRGAADARRSDDEAAVRARVRRVAGGAARARGGAPAGGDGNGGLRGGRAGVPREAPGSLQGPLTRIRGDSRGRLPHCRRAVPDRHRRRRSACAGRRSSTSAATPHERLDHVRRLLVHEPRGHADMYGCHVVEPNDDGADLGVVFFHNAGYSTACGHGTIALVTWALDEGVVERAEGENHVVVDVPSGRLETWAHVENGRVRSVRFRNVPCVRPRPRARDRRTHASTSRSAARSTRRSRSASQPAELPRLIELGREIKRRLEAWHDDRPPARARAPRRLRRDLLAGRGRRPADAAQRHRLRGRRGRPLAVRQRHVRAPRAPRSRGTAPTRRRAPASEHRRHGVSRPRRRRDGGRGPARPSSPRSREAPTARASTSSRSTADDPLADGFLLR